MYIVSFMYLDMHTQLAYVLLRSELSPVGNVMEDWLHCYLFECAFRSPFSFNVSQIADIKSSKLQP